MNIAIISLSFTTVLFTVFVTLLFLKDDVCFYKRIISILVLLLIFSLTFYDMRLYRYHINNTLMVLISIFLLIICFSKRLKIKIKFLICLSKMQ